MAYFSGDVMRGDRAMANAIGVIYLHADGPDDPVFGYTGEMDLWGWKPSRADEGTTLRLSVGVGFTMNIRVLKATPATDREPARIAFKSEGAPVGVPPRTSLTPPRSDDR